MSEETARIACEHGFTEKGDKVVITAGVPYKVEEGAPIFVEGTTNLLRILEIG